MFYEPPREYHVLFAITVSLVKRLLEENTTATLRIPKADILHTIMTRDRYVIDLDYEEDALCMRLTDKYGEASSADPDSRVTHYKLDESHADKWPAKPTPLPPWSPSASDRLAFRKLGIYL